MNYLGNAFSLQMLQDEIATIDVNLISKEDIPSDCVSVIGHQDLADFLGVPMNRVNTKLSRTDVLYVAQFIGGRLPEGVNMLDAEQMGMIAYYRVTVEYPAQVYFAQNVLDNPEDYGLV